MTVFHKTRYRSVVLWFTQYLHHRKDVTQFSSTATLNSYDWFYWHFNLPSVILCWEVMESYSLYSQIYIFLMHFFLILVFNWNHFEMRLLNLRINFYLLRTFCPHLGSFCVVSSFTTFQPNFKFGQNSERRNTKTTKMRTKSLQ